VVGQRGKPGNKTSNGFSLIRSLVKHSPDDRNAKLLARVREWTQGASGTTWRWSLGFAALLIVHLIYEIFNDAPPVWDMAYHQIMGLQYLEAWDSGALCSQFSGLSSYYPPLYYLQEALVIGLVSYTQFLPLLANLPGLFLLGFCTFRTAEQTVGHRWAWLAGLLPLLLPLVAWTSRESLLDVSLSGWVAAAVYVLWRSRMLQRHGWSLLLGVVFALGMLTKWTFVLFLVFPLGYALYASGDRKRSLLHLLDAVLVALPPVFYWYLPNLKSLAARFTLTSGVGTSLEQDPTAATLLGWLYYPRALASYYLYLPLTLLFVFGIVRWLREPGRENRGEGTRLLWWWLGGALLVLTLLDAKDPRYVMPAAAPLTILLVRFWRDRSPVVAVIGLVAFLQFFLVSFNILGKPVKWALFDIPGDSDYISVGREWVFFQTHYFDAAGPAHREDWALDDILRLLPDGEPIAMVPEVPRFNSGTLRLAGLVRGRDLEIVRLGDSPHSVDVLREFKWVVGKTGHQGISYLTAYNCEIYRKMAEDGRTIAGRWKAPDGGWILLWRSYEER